MGEDFFEINGLEAGISALVSGLNAAALGVNAQAAQALSESGEIIMREQRRLVSVKYPQLAGKIRLVKSASGKRHKVTVGYDSAAIAANPEVLVIEFGRPGKSPRRSSPTDKIGRKKGSFPQLIHIRAGYFLAKEKAVKHLCERLYEIAQKNIKG